MSEEMHSLDEWILENEMEDLVEEIEAQLEEYITDSDDVSEATRLVLISMRQHMRTKGFDNE